MFSAACHRIYASFTALSEIFVWYIFLYRPMRGYVSRVFLHEQSHFNSAT